ncbi:MAG: hypothetical protein R3F31_16705 [Verrucomicrobiales bacterium]
MDGSEKRSLSEPAILGGAGHKYRFHASRFGRIQAGLAIFKNEALLRGYPHPLGSEQEHIWS